MASPTEPIEADREPVAVDPPTAEAKRLWGRLGKLAVAFGADPSEGGRRAEGAGAGGRKSSTGSRRARPAADPTPRGCTRGARGPGIAPARLTTARLRPAP